jgi:hypothetical protein
MYYPTMDDTKEMSMITCSRKSAITVKVANLKRK